MARTISYSPSQIGMSAKAATGVGTVINVRGATQIEYNIGTASSADMTIKWRAALAGASADLTSAASATNRWFYVDFAAYNDAGSVTDGDTGLVYAGTDANKGVRINVDNIELIAMEVSARSAGSVTADMSVTF